MAITPLQRSSTRALGARGFLSGFGKALGKVVEGSAAQRRTQHWQRVVPHANATIYRAVADVGAYSTFLPWCLSSRVLDSTIDGNGAGELKTEISVGFTRLQSHFTSTVTLDPLRRIDAKSEANEFIEYLNFSWAFSPIGERACRLDLTLDFALRNAEHTLLWEIGQDKVITEYVRCFSARCVSLESATEASDRR